MWKGARCNEQNTPKHRTNHDGFLPTQFVGDETLHKSTQPRAGRHGGGDATLNRRSWTSARSISALVKITKILLRRNYSRHGRDVETKQAAPDDGDGRDNVEIANRHDCGGVRGYPKPHLLRSQERRGRESGRSGMICGRQQGCCRHRNGAHFGAEGKQRPRCVPAFVASRSWSDRTKISGSQQPSDRTA